jgi:hypothetical protein
MGQGIIKHVGLCTEMNEIDMWFGIGIWRRRRVCTGGGGRFWVKPLRPPEPYMKRQDWEANMFRRVARLASDAQNRLTLGMI